MPFFEKQNSKDCSVHSLNNAMGRVIITPEEVSAEIDKRVAAYASILSLPLDSKVVSIYKKQLVDNDTFFSAESVWYAAAALGRCTLPKRLAYPGSLTPEIVHKDHLIFLGKGKEGEPHAVGVRNGEIYDSLNKSNTPIPLTEENISAIYKQVLGVYAI
jgi:hypothetical protein